MPWPHIDWRDLGAGFALYLVLEGVAPFLAPERLKNALRRLASMPGPTIRLCGLSSMVAGCLLLYLIRS